MPPPPPDVYPQLSTEAKMRILSEIKREISLPQQNLSERAPTSPRPGRDKKIDSGGDGDVAATAEGRNVDPLLGERLVSPGVAAGTAEGEEGDLKVELEAVKERLRLAEEQLRCANHNRYRAHVAY